MAFGMLVASIGGSLIQGIAGSKAAGQSAEDALENIRLQNKKELHDRMSELRNQAFDRGSNRVSAGVSGLDVSSFADVFASNEIDDQRDLEALRFNSNLIKRGFERDRQNARAAGQSALIDAGFDIGSSILSFKKD